MKKLSLILAIASLVLVSACGSEKPEEPSVEVAGTDPIVAMKLDAEPAGVQNVIDVKKDAKVGDEVVVFGRVRAFAGAYASFTLTGDAVEHCAEKHDDRCPTPWDYCCEEPDDVTAHSLTVEFLDGKRPLKTALKGHAGFEYLNDVVVKGKIAAVSDGNVIVSAEGYYFRP